MRPPPAHYGRHASYTLDVETRSDIARLALAPDGRLLIAVDVDGYGVVVNLARRVVVHRFNFKAPVRDLRFSPDGSHLAVTHGRKLEVWRTPGLEREFSPFALLRVYTGHFDDLTCLDWSPNGAYIVTGSRDMTARIYSRDPTPGFVPVTLSGHRDHLIAVFFAAEDVVYTVSRDGGVFVWTWRERPELRGGAALGAAAKLQRAVEEGVEGGTDDDDDGSGSEGGDGDGGDGGGGGGDVVEHAAADASAPKRRRTRRWSEAGAADDNDAPAATQGTSGTGAAPAAGAAAAPPQRRSTAALASRMPHPVPAPFAVPAGAAAIASLTAARGEWGLTSKQFFRQEGARVASAALHAGASLLVVGFTSGVFGLYTMPDGGNVHTLSISQHEVHSVAVSASGEWLAFGSRTLGQLLVWEWRTETYVLKQQGHVHDVSSVGYSPNGQLMATGGDDGKVKVWNAATGFCLVTFAEHTAPVTAVTFMGGRGGGHGLAVVSASLDGSVRAFDLVRYRNFRTLAAPTPVQFVSLAADEAGEVVCAGTLEPFSVYVWSLQTGRVTDVLSGHEGPVVSLAFSGAAGLLASASWDKTVRLWDVFKSGTAVETLAHGADVLAVAFRPDGGQVAAASLDGQITFWDPKRGVQTGSVDGRRDATGGPLAGGAGGRGAKAAGKYFSVLAYTADGEAVLAGGRSKYVCLYAVAPALLLRKWQVSHNRSLDGVVDRVHSKAVGEGGLALADLDLDPGDPWERKK